MRRHVRLMMAGAAAVAVSACGEPSGPSSEPRTAEGVLSFDAILVVDSARQSFWLAAGDTIAVRLRVVPNESAAVGGRTEGMMRYAGVPIWYSAPADSAAFVTSYFTVENLRDQLVGVFWGENMVGARLVLILDPQRLSLQWAVTANSPDGGVIEFARGKGSPLPTS